MRCATDSEAQALRSGEVLVRLPAACQLTHGGDTDDPRLAALIARIPATNLIMRLAMCVL